MTPAAPRRARLVLLRALAHKRAQREHRAAGQVVHTIESVLERTEAVLESSGIAIGRSDGRQLQTARGLTERLEQARIDLVPRLTQAKATLSDTDRRRTAAKAAETHMADHHADASRREGIARETREASTRPHLRKRPKS